MPRAALRAPARGRYSNRLSGNEIGVRWLGGPALTGQALSEWLYFPKSSRTFLSLEPVALSFKLRLVH